MIKYNVIKNEVELKTKIKCCFLGLKSFLTSIPQYPLLDYTGILSLFENTILFVFHLYN